MTDIQPPDSRSDEALVAGIADGDPSALSELFRRHQALVYRFAVHLGARPAAADDVTQEAFLAVIADARRYEPGRSSVAAWLCGIARNHVRRRFERDRRLLPIDDREEVGRAVAVPTDVAADLVRAERIDQVRQAVQSLPMNYREAVVLCDLQEMSYADAAAALNCPIGTVRSRVHRGRALLAARMRRGEHAGRRAGSRRPVRRYA